MSYVRPHMRNGRPVRGHQRRTPGNRVRVRSTVDSNGVPRRAHYRAKPHTAAATARSAGSARPVEVAGVGVLIALVLAGIAAVAPKADSTPADRPDPAPIVDTTDGR